MLDHGQAKAVVIMNTDRKLKISLPGSTPERLAQAEQAALVFFAAVGTTPYLAAHAHWRCEGFFEFGCAEFGSDEDVKAAQAWDHVDSVVAEALGQPWALVELASPSEETAGAAAIDGGQSGVGTQGIGLIEDLGRLELKQGPGIPF